MPVKGLIMFEASVNGHTLLSVDASTVGAPGLFQMDVSQWCSYDADSNDDSAVEPACNVTFTTYPTAAAAEPINAWVRRDVYRTSYVYDAKLVDQIGTAGPVALAGGAGKDARNHSSTVSARMTPPTRRRKMSTRCHSPIATLRSDGQ